MATEKSTINRRRDRRPPEDPMTTTRVPRGIATRIWSAALVVGCSLLITCTPAGAQQEKDTESTSADDYIVKLSLLPEYSEGKDGTGHTTQILEVPFRADWSATDRLDLSLTIPYLWVRGRGDTTIVNGRPVRVVGRRPGQVTTEDGLADILGEIDYTLLEDKGFVPDLTPFLEIKFPTADSSRGLGTGEFDEKITCRKVSMAWSTVRDGGEPSPSILDECSRPGGRGATFSVDGCSRRSAEVLVHQSSFPSCLRTNFNRTLLFWTREFATTLAGFLRS